MTWKKDFKNVCSNILLSEVPQACSCDYMPPTIDKLIMRILKDGRIQIKINGKGKWINAEYDPERKVITYLA